MFLTHCSHNINALFADHFDTHKKLDLTKASVEKNLSHVTKNHKGFVKLLFLNAQKKALT